MRRARRYLPDGVSGTETDPLRNGAVGLLGLGQLDLGAERLVALGDVLAGVLVLCFLSSPDRVRGCDVMRCDRCDVVDAIGVVFELLFDCNPVVVAIS